MTYRLQDLIDLKQFQSLQDRLNEIYSFPSAIIDNDGTILTATAWQEICTKFHRVHPESEKECIKSDKYILSHLHEAKPAVTYRCPHGLVDNATPIVIEGVHYGNFFTGQFFMEPPDLDVFRAQARRYGFDEDAYLAAVRKVPVWSREQLNSYLYFIKGLIEVISAIGLKNLRQVETGRKLKESENLLQAITEGASDAIYIKDRSGRYLLANSATLNFLGRTREEVIGKDDTALFSARDAGLIISFDRQVMGSGEVRTTEEPLTVADGTARTFLSSKGPVRNAHGEIIGIFGIARDITDRIRAQQALEQAVKEWSTAMDASSDAIYLLDAERRLLRANKPFYAMTGLGAETAVGRRIPEILHAGVPEESCPVCSAQKAMGDLTFTLEPAHPANPTRRPLAVSSKMIRGDNGELSSILVTMHDLTRDLEAREERRRLEEQLYQAQKMEAIGQLAGGVAHDFNNMLTSIIGYGHLLRLKLGASQPAAEYVDQILSAAEKSANLTRQLLAFSRKQVIEMKPVDLCQLIHGVEKLLRRIIGEDISLKTSVPEAPLTIRGDRGQIEQVLMNLASNARDAMPAGGELTIEVSELPAEEGHARGLPCKRPGAWAFVSVTDTGTGIDEEAKDKIFEPFFTTKEPGKGTGLGLSMAYGIVRQHGGEIACSSRVGAGSTFLLAFPLVQPDPCASAAEAAPKARGGEETILLAEDQEEVRSTVTAILEGAGYTVIGAVDGTDAAEKFRRYRDRIGLVITDLVMPRKSGKGLADEIRAASPGLPCLIMSGYTADVIKQQALAEEAVNLIPKPFHPEALLQRVRAALDEAPALPRPGPIAP